MKNEIDFEELDKEVGKAMSGEGKQSKTPAKAPAASAPPEPPQPKSPPRPIQPRGMYMDMVRPGSGPGARPTPATKSFPTASTTRVVRTTRITETRSPEPAQAPPADDEPEFGVIEDVNRELAIAQDFIEQATAAQDFVAKPEAMRDLPTREETISDYDEEPDANNYSLGGRSPFIPDAKVEKRPLGDFIPEDSTRAVKSTRNVYSQRTPVEQKVPDVKTIVVDTPKKKSGWIWVLITLLVIIIGGGLGWLAFIMYGQ